MFEVIDIFTKVVIVLILMIISFTVGVGVTNFSWQRKIDDITKKLLDTTEEELLKVYEKKYNRGE